MIKSLTPGKIISITLSLGFFYLVMSRVDFTNSETTFGKIADMAAALTIWMVMLYFAGRYFAQELYRKYISKLIK